ncbi:MAG: hypothetical protein JNK79_10930 [Chitinophagaceae bacterium]|nr:hypothetical protein [Chitinophagaceae bacterium]
MTFDELHWHDAVIENIQIDRSNPGYNDPIVISIRWPDGSRHDVVFTDVYKAFFELNFGVIAEEAISNALVSNDDEDYKKFKEKWRILIADVDAINCFVIRTSSTGSILKVFSKEFHLMGSTK